jgi:hypothetical protein
LIDHDESNLTRIIAALAATRENLGRIDCALVDEQRFMAGGFTITRSEGVTPDAEANETWHRDVVCLSGDRLVVLATVVLQHLQRRRYEEDDLVGLIATGIANRQIDRSKLNPKLRDKFLITG